MATNNEIAAFEDFKFQVGQPVRLVAERILTKVTTDEANRGNGTAHLDIIVGLVFSRWLVQDESGISRYYYVRGVDFNTQFKEFELESVIV